MIRKLLFVNVFIRSFFIQSGWNYKSLLSLGFCFSILPLAKYLYKNDRDKIASFTKRHLNFINGHPFFMSFALGATIRLEEEIEQGNSTIDQLVKFKEALIGPLGALGDQIFWVSVKPATFTLAVLGLFLIENIHFRLTFLCLLAILYNAPHLYIRISGMVKGYKEGFSIFKYLKIENFKHIKLFYSILGIISIGLVIGWIAAKYVSFNIPAILVFVLGLGFTLYIKSKKSKTYLAMIFPVLIALIIGFIDYIT
jgi:mannose/fructose/N-acetylgalactosamine-specific phosphotransferase system component IID